jgi:hypothetical protein
MTSVNQTFQYLCARLKNMGYKGDSYSVRDIKRFLNMNSKDPNYKKAVEHLNALVELSYQKTAFVPSTRDKRPSDMLRSSSLVSGHSTAKYIK